jgi:hypothetical protein
VDYFRFWTLDFRPSGSLWRLDFFGSSGVGISFPKRGLNDPGLGEFITHATVEGVLFEPFLEHYFCY